MKFTFLAFLLLSLNSLAQSFECVSPGSMKTQPEHFYRVQGEVLADGNLDNVVLSLTHQSDLDDHVIVKTNGEVAPDKSFHPKKDKLKGYDKFALEKNGKDAVLLFIPSQISGSDFAGYVKFGFEGTFPSLELLNCKL